MRRSPRPPWQGTRCIHWCSHFPSRCRGCVRRRWRLLVELVLVIACASLLFVVVKRPFDGSSDNKTQESRTRDSVCVTADCVQLASTVLQAMDPSADPCTDFYQVPRVIHALASSGYDRGVWFVACSIHTCSYGTLSLHVVDSFPPP